MKMNTEFGHTVLFKLIVFNTCFRFNVVKSSYKIRFNIPNIIKFNRVDYTPRVCNLKTPCIAQTNGSSSLTVGTYVANQYLLKDWAYNVTVCNESDPI